MCRYRSLGCSPFIVCDLAQAQKRRPNCDYNHASESAISYPGSAQKTVKKDSQLQLTLDEDSK